MRTCIGGERMKQVIRDGRNKDVGIFDYLGKAIKTVHVGQAQIGLGGLVLHQSTEDFENHLGRYAGTHFPQDRS